MKHSIIIRFAICIGFLMNVSLAYSQDEYENVNVSSWKWTNNSNLYYFSNTINKLHIFNQNAESKEKIKNNKLSSLNTWLQIPNDKGKAYTITFTARNENDPLTHQIQVWGKDKNGKRKEMWHKTDIIWGVDFQYADNGNNSKDFEVLFCNKAKKIKGSYNHTITRNTDQEWRICADIMYRTFRVEYDGFSKLEIYQENNNYPIKTIYNCNGLKWIGIQCGCAAQIIIDNFSFKRKTLLATAMPEINNANELIKSKNYSEVIKKMTKVLESYKGPLPYYYRARAYLGQDYCRSAIDDCNSGLSYYCEKELRENLHFIRGFSKLSLKDDTGVDDMRNAGEIGMRFLRENGLSDYVPGQSNKTPTTKNKSSNSGTVNRSTNRIPTLKKTN